MRFGFSKLLSCICTLVLLLQVAVVGTAYADSISKLVLSKNELTLQVGDTANLTATAIFTSGSTENATVKADWNSGSTDIASVYAGVITAKKEGTAVITATYMDKTEIVNITVTKKVKSLTKDKLSLDLRLDQTEQIKITAYYNDGTSEEVTNRADYTVDAGSIVSVTNGLVRAQSPGSAVVTISYMGQVLTLPVDVEVVRRIDAKKSQVSLLTGDTEKVELIATYPDGTSADVSEKAVWTTDKENVADVIKGTIKGYGVGTATLTASYGTKTTTIVADVDNALKIDLNTQYLFMKKDDTGTLTLTATYANPTTTKDVSSLATWTSADTNIVDVSNGKLVARAIGETTITAKYGDKTVSATVDVEVPRRLVIDKETLSAKTGDEPKLTLYATYADNTTEDVTSRATWKSSDESIAYVSKGSVKAYKAGTATITAFYGNKTTTTKVEVDIPNSIQPNKKTVNIQIGGSEQITLASTFMDGHSEDITSKAEWSTSNVGVAEVRNGYIVGVSTGTASITAKYGTRTAVVQVSVGVLKSLTISPESLVLKKGDTSTLTATALYTDDTSKNATSDVIWTSSNPKIITVDAGKVKAIASGEATITAQLDTKTTTVQVQVDMADTLVANVSVLMFDLNETRTITLTATDSQGTSNDVTANAEWKTNNATVATVAKGVVTAVARGKATITATYGGKTINIPVEIGVIQSLSANKTYISTKSGSQVQVTLMASLPDGTMKDVTNSATWKIASYKLGTVDNGLFTATNPGKTTLTASFSGKTVSIPVEIDMLKYLKTDIVKTSVREGETVEVTAIATYTDGSDGNVTQPALWTTSNIQVADVKDGIIRAIGKGTATITVAYSNMKTMVVVTVTK